MPMNFPRPALCTLLLALSTPMVWAADEPNPYYFGVSQSVTADTNVRRAAKGQPIAKDLISGTGLSAGVDQPVGRGRLTAELSANANRYAHTKQFNHTGYETRGRLDWESMYRLSGDIGAYDKQSLYRNDPGGTLQAAGISDRDLLRSSGASLRARIGLVTLLTLEGGLSYDRSRHSSEALKGNDLTQTSGNLGVRVRPSSLWSARLGVRHTEGESPDFKVASFDAGTGLVTQQTLAGDQTERDDVDLSGTWTPNGTSQFDARISSTHLTHTVQSPEDSRFVTGMIGYDWALTGKTKLRLQFSRDTTVGNSDSELRTVPVTSDSTGLTNGFLMRGTWNATSKITADASASYTRRTTDGTIRLNDGSGTVFSSTNTNDRSTGVTLGVAYKAMRSVDLGCRLSHDQRTVDTTDATGGTPETSQQLRYTTGTCYAQFRLQ